MRTQIASFSPKITSFFFAKPQSIEYFDRCFVWICFVSFLDYFRSDEFSSSSFLSYCTNINAISSSCRRRSLSGAVITILMLSSDKNPWFGFLMKKDIYYVPYNFEEICQKIINICFHAYISLNNHIFRNNGKKGDTNSFTWGAWWRASNEVNRNNLKEYMYVMKDLTLRMFSISKFY